MVKAEMSFEQIRKALKKLPIKQRVKLAEELERDTWEVRFKKMFTQIDARQKKNPISQKEINRLVEEAREEFYARNRS